MHPILPLAFATALFIGMTACGDSGGAAGAGGATGDGGAGGGVTGLCQEGKTSLSGDVDGVGIELSVPKTGHALDQISDPATYAIQFQDGSIRFAWTGGALSAGQSAPVTGDVRVNGTTYCFASGTLTLGGDGAFDEFEVSGLSESTDDGITCPGASVTGTLDGCSDSD